jgi:hypothetical protein
MERSVAPTIPAVSVLNLVLPRETGSKPLSSASVISCAVKSPSGPISRRELFAGLIPDSAVL